MLLNRNAESFKFGERKRELEIAGSVGKKKTISYVNHLLHRWGSYSHLGDSGARYQVESLHRGLGGTVFGLIDVHFPAQVGEANDSATGYEIAEIHSKRR